MRLARVLGAIGRGLISAGVIVLLFVAYQLWGTGLQHQQAQGNLENEFLEELGVEDVASDVEALERAAAETTEDIEGGQILAVPLSTDAETVATDQATSAASNDAEPADTAALVEANLDDDERAAIIAKLYPDPGEAFARIVIPDINVDQIVVEGVSVEDLRKGPGHYQSTPNPGQAGNASIAGHRTTYGAPFHRVDELKPGASIFVTTAQGTFHYKVQAKANPGGGPQLGYFIVDPSEVGVLADTGENLLTLTACHPKYSARQRIIVQAVLQGEPAPTIPRGEATDLPPLTIDSGATDERAGEITQIISDEVAADDDPSVDADGNPIDGVAIDAVDDGVTEVADEAAAEPAPAVEEELETAVADEAAPAEATEEVEEPEAEVALLDEDDIELTSAQTPFGEQDFGEGLNGDRTKIKPAIMWGISGLFIWIASSFIGRRVDRKWTLYAIGLVPFGLVLWSTFVNIDQALPSY